MVFSYVLERVLACQTVTKLKCFVTTKVPREFHVHFLENSEFKRGFLGSKASGEPPLVCATSVYAALRMAIAAARPEGSPFFSLDIPCTVDRIAIACRG